MVGGIILKTRTIMTLVGALALLLAACASAATPTAAPATATPTRVAAATATPTVPPPGGGATPQPTATPAPTAVAAAGPKYGGTLNYFLPWDPRGMDLFLVGSDWTAALVQNAFTNTLYTREYPTGDCVFKTVPILAEGYKWVDDLTVEVSLKPGIKFHNKPPVNGREVVAQDWVESLTFMLPRQAIMGVYAQTIDRIEARGKYTLIFRLKESLGYLPEAMLPHMTRPIVMPPEARTGPRNDYSDPYKSMIATGPFMFKDWVPGVKVAGVRNPDYFKKGLPYVDGIELLVMPDISTRVSAFRSGKLDVLTEVPTVMAQIFRGTQVRATTCPNFSGFGTYWMHTDKAPWNDVRVRRALSMALDRKAMVDTLFLGQGELFGLIDPPKGHVSLPLKDFPPEVRKYLEYHPEEARQLLAEAGYSKGLDFTIETTTGYGSIHVQGFEMAVDMWNRVGARGKIVFVPQAEYLQRVTQDAIYKDVSWTRPGLSEPFGWLARLDSRGPPGRNNSYVKDPELDRLIEAYNRAKGVQAQTETAHKVQIRIADQAYLIMLPLPMENALEQPYVRDFGRQGYLGYVGTFYERIWFDRYIGKKPG